MFQKLFILSGLTLGLLFSTPSFAVEQAGPNSVNARIVCDGTGAVVSASGGSSFERCTWTIRTRFNNDPEVVNVLNPAPGFRQTLSFPLLNSDSYTVNQVLRCEGGVEDGPRVVSLDFTCKIGVIDSISAER